MGLAHRGKPKPEQNRPKKSSDFMFPFVPIVALPLLILLNLYGTRDYDTSIYSGVIAAVLEALAAWLVLGVSKSDFQDYFWIRLLGIAIVTAVFFPIAYFAIGWPPLTSVMISIGGSLAAWVALMLKTGDL